MTPLCLCLHTCPLAVVVVHVSLHACVRACVLCMYGVCIHMLCMCMCGVCV